MYLFFCFSQSNKDSLRLKLVNADKIEIVSHEDLLLIKDKLGKSKSYYRKIVENQKPNKSIINERIKLNAESINDLLKLLNGNPQTIIGYDLSCFEPHHTILIYKKNKCSYLDICFECKKNSSSGDFLFNENFMKSEEDWYNLEAFFRKSKIEYKMPKIKI